jgi:integrase
LLTHCVPSDLRALPLRSLTAARLQAWVNALAAKGLAPRTVAKALAEVHRWLQVAVKQGRIASNVAADVAPPERAHVERKRLTSEQATAFLKAAESDPLNAFFVLALLTGARPAELLALTWADVDGGEMIIRRSIANGAHRTRVVADTKTGRERRMTLGPRERAALARHKLRLGHVPAADTFIFAGPSGRPRDAAAITHRHFANLLTVAGLPHMRLYDLRHSSLSILADEGIDPKVIQERAGHANIKTTYDNYIHAHPSGQAMATAALNRALGVGGS